VSNVPFPIFSAQWFPVWKRRAPSLHVSIIWFSCELGPLIWGIGAYTRRSLLTSTSAVRHLRSITGE
jgi:hypothetical protein